MKVKNIFLVVILCFFCSNLWASDKRVENWIAEDGFIHHVIVREDTGWTYFASSYGIPVELLRSWNEEVSKGGIDYFPVGAVIKYKTREMLVQEANAETEKTVARIEEQFAQKASDLEEQIVGLQKVAEEIVDFQESAMEAAAPEIVLEQNSSRSKASTVAVGLAVLALLIIACLFTSKTRRSAKSVSEQEEEKPLFSNKVVDFNVQAIGLRCFFTPVMGGEDHSFFLCPYLDKDGELKMRTFSTLSVLKKSLISSLKKNPELVEMIKRDEARFGKLITEPLRQKE